MVGGKLRLKGSKAPRGVAATPALASAALPLSSASSSSAGAAASSSAAAPVRQSGTKRPASELVEGEREEEGTSATETGASSAAAGSGGGGGPGGSGSGSGANGGGAGGGSSAAAELAFGPADGGVDERTPAQRAFDAVQAKRLKDEAKKMASKSHSERVSELNEKLKKAPEHNDLFRISYGGQG